MVIRVEAGTLKLEKNILILMELQKWFVNWFFLILEKLHIYTALFFQRMG